LSPDVFAKWKHCMIFLATLKAGIFSLKRFSLLSLKRVFVIDILKTDKKPRSRSLYFLFKLFQTRDIIYQENKWDLL
jgi:hypothetical protein